MKKELIIFHFSYFIFIIISLIIRSRQEIKEYNIELPIIFPLLNNRNVVVNLDGIHFYDESLTNENYDKNITFETPIQIENHDFNRISMAQFDQENGEYILILVRSIIYIFKSDETLLNSSDISSVVVVSEINGEHYSLIPYKKYNNFLDYFILYVDNLNIYINHFNLDISTKNNEIKKWHIFQSFNENGRNAEVLEGINCIFMAPIPSFNVSYDLLTCFYCVNYPPSIASSVYDQDNNFTEIKRFYRNNSNFTHECSYINGITNQNKNKALIYINQGGRPLYCTFDFINGFSPIVSESENDIYLIKEAYYLQKMIYNTIAHEYVIFGLREIYECQIYILIYDTNYRMKKKGILQFNSTYCVYIINYSIMKTGDSFSVLINGNMNDKSVGNNIEEMQIININYNEITSIALTNSFTELKTTINIDISPVETNIISDTNKMTYNIISTESSSRESTLLNHIQTINSSFTEGNLITDSSSINTSLTEKKSSTSLLNEVKTIELNSLLLNDEEIILNSEECDIKCLTCSEKSKKLNLCITCNTINGNYIPVFNYNNNFQNYYECFLKDSNNIENSKDNILENIRNALINGNLNLLIDNIIKKEKKNIIYKYDNLIYELSSTDIENHDNNISSINLGKCENKIKNSNDINLNDSLLILKVDIYEEGMLIPIIEYEIYNFETKKKLNLSLSKNDKVDISIPVNIDETNVYKHNISDDYYNDICYIIDSKIDIILNDRRNEYYINNMSVCEKDCIFKEYNFTTKKVLCECFIKINFPLISKISFNKDKFINDFKNISNIINLDIIKCYKIVFTKKGLIKNIGNYILIFIIIINIILFVLFKKNGFKEVKNQIDNIKKNNEEIKNRNNKKQKYNPPKNKIKNKRKKNKNIIKNIINVEAMNDISNVKFKNNNETLDNNNKMINKIKFNDNELNNLSYEKAFIIDKRKYFDYYFSLLKTKHILLFTFFNNNDYNSKIIKIYLFLFTLALFLVTNALFYNDSTMHKIYELQGNYNFINQIPIIFYSSIISSFISIIIKYLSLSENDILNLKSEINSVKEKSEKILICLKIKFSLFFILTFILLILFWYYICCFCAIYRNTQIHLIKDCLSSYGLSLLYPIIIYLVPGIFRIPSLKAKNKDKETMYKFSKLLQWI